MAEMEEVQGRYIVELQRFVSPTHLSPLTHYFGMGSIWDTYKGQYATGRTKELTIVA